MVRELQITACRRLLRTIPEGVPQASLLHQAVLAGTLPAVLSQDDIVELPHPVNYALHMHTEYPAELRARSLEDVVTCRYESSFNDDGWSDVDMGDALRQWLTEQFGASSSA